MRRFLLILFLLLSVVSSAEAITTYFLRACGTNGDGTLSTCTGGSAGSPGAFSTLANAVTVINGLTLAAELDLDCSGAFTPSQVDFTLLTSAVNRIKIFAQSGNTCSFTGGLNDYMIRFSNSTSVNFTFDNVGIHVTIPAGTRASGITEVNALVGDIKLLNSTCDYANGSPSTNAENSCLDVQSFGGTITVVNNTVAGFFNGINIRSIFQTGAVFNVYNNTVYGNRRSGLSLDGGGTADTLNLYNNVMDVNTTVDIEIPDGAFATFNHSNNRTADTSGSTTLSPETGGSKTCTYTNTGTGDFTLTSGATNCIDQGISLAADAQYPFAADKIGTVRPQGAAWDIGSYERIGGALVSSLTTMKVSGTH